MARQFSTAASSALVQVLTEDHEKILNLFAEFARMDERFDEATKQTLVEIACIELVIHARVEEEYLYPALRKELERSDLLDEAHIEHMVACQLIGELESMMPDDEFYDARFRVLGAYVKHHIEEEQEKIFPLLHQAGFEMKSLADGLIRRRNELRSEFGLPDSEYEEQDRGGRFMDPSHQPPRPHS